MTGLESRPIAGASIPGVAAAMETRHKSFAGGYGFVCALVAVAGAGMAVHPTHNTRFDDATTAIVGFGFWFGLFAFGLVRRLRKASRARAAGKTGPEISWHLQGTQLVAADASGAPRIELSFPITRKLRSALLAVPQAKVVAN